MTANREIELKFTSEPAALAAWHDELRAAKTAQRKNAHLRTTYFDTPEHSLKDKGVFVRVRRTGKGLEQSIKQATGVSRGEWEHKIDRARPRPDLIGDRSVKSLLRKKKVANSLRSIFETHVERESFVMQADTTEIEVSVDRGDIRVDGRKIPIGEIELELKKGDASELFRLAQHLVARMPVTLTLVSKGERGFLLAEGKWGVAQKALKPSLRRGMAAGEAFKMICTACLHSFMLNHAMFKDTTDDQEFVHQSRIAIRRLRAAMTFFKPIARDPQFEVLRQDLKWISDLLGAARDLDVWQTSMLMPKEEEPQRAGALTVLVHDFEERRLAAHARLKDALSSERLRSLLLSFAIWLERAQWTDVSHDDMRARPIESFLEDNIRRRIDKLVKRGRALKRMDAHAQHELRIHAKKLRYIAEFFEDVVKGRRRRKAFKKLVGALEGMQSALGEIHDSVTFSAFLTDEFGRLEPSEGASRHVPAAFAAGSMSRPAVPEKKVLRKAKRAYRELTGWRKFWVA